MAHIDPLRPQSLLYTERGETWINSFLPRDRETARWLVDGLTLVSLSTFSRAIQRMVITEFEASGGPIALFAIREVNAHVSYFQQAAIKNKSVQFVSPVASSANIGSEGHVASIIRQIAKGDPRMFLNHPTIDEMRKRQCRSILAIDDLIGSGHRTRKFLDAIWLDRTIRSWWSLGYASLRAIAFSSTRHGMRHVARARYTPAVVVDRTCPTYPELPWPRHKRDAISTLCKSCTPVKVWPPAKPGALTVSRSKRPVDVAARGHLSHPTGGYFIPTCPNSPASSHCQRPGVYDQDRSRVTEQPPQCCCRRHGFKTGVPAPGRTLEEADITIPHRLHCGRPSWGLSW